MLLHAVLSLALALLPVLVFLLVLVLLDSYKLLPWDRVARMLVLGSVAAIVSFGANSAVRHGFPVDPVTLRRDIAPLVEELVKGSIVIALLLTRRFGFLVDAAICGFAVGAGFSAFENIYYLRALPGDTSLVLWTIRGFGTAIMHGSVTAITAVAAKQLSDRHGGATVLTIAPGWLAAMALHFSFNHFWLSPNLSAAILLLMLPAFGVVFRLSESKTREWLGAGFDSDQELLAAVNSGRISETRISHYLVELKSRFEGTTVVDMLCLLRLRLELSIRAKGILIMRKAGFTPAPDPTFNERFAEMKFLEKSIGPTGLIALKPIVHISDRDLWQYHMLGAK